MTETIPPEYICPITLRIMEDPIICSDGYSYDKQSIINLKNMVSPKTGEILNKDIIIPNKNLKQLIIKYNKNNPEKLKQLAKIKIEQNRKLSQWEQLEEQRHAEIINRVKKEQESRERIEKEKLIRDKKEKEKEEERKRKIAKYFQLKWDDTILSNYNLYEIITYLYNYEYGELYIEYTQLISDINWIKKYVYGINGSVPLIDYIFDNYNNIEFIKDRSYYYTDTDIIEKYKKSEYMTNLNKDRRNKLMTFINANKLINISPNPIIELKNSIDKSQKNIDNEYIRDCNTRDFNELFKLGKILCEIIEMCKPEIIVDI